MVADRQGSASPFTVVLTGGIASGKSAVSGHFESLGVPIIDTDVIAREIVEPGRPALEAITRSFGEKMLLGDGTLDREKMRVQVFANPSERERLESIVHPLIRDEALRRRRAVTAPYCVLVIPLYSASSRYPAQRVLVVDTDEETQVRRLMARDSISRELALSILNAQVNRETRLALADDVIRNNGDLADLQAQVTGLHERYARLAAVAGA